MGCLERLFQKLVMGHHLIHKPLHERFFRFDGFTGGNHFKGIRETHKPGQPLGSSCSRNEADLHLGLSQVNALGRNAIVADHGGLQTTAKAISINGGNDRFGPHLDAVQKLCGPECNLKYLIPILYSLQLRDVGAGDEVFSRSR